jgi:hypothetical protein
MMTTKYKLLKDSNNELLLHVDIQTTPGVLATTSVYTILNYDKKIRQKLENSTDVNCFYKIGVSKEWNEALLVIKILLDLNNIDETRYQNVFDTTKIYYHLSGGEKNEKFEHMESDVIVKTKNGKKILFEKRFFLIS